MRRQGPVHLGQDQLLVFFRLGVTDEDEFSIVGGGEMDVHELDLPEFLQDLPDRQSRCPDTQLVTQRDLHAVSQEADENVRLNPPLQLMKDGPDG